MNWGTLTGQGWSRRGIWLEEPSLAGFVFQTDIGETVRIERNKIRSITMFKHGDYRISFRDGDNYDLVRDEAI